MLAFDKPLLAPQLTPCCAMCRLRNPERMRLMHLMRKCLMFYPIKPEFDAPYDSISQK